MNALFRSVVTGGAAAGMMILAGCAPDAPPVTSPDVVSRADRDRGDRDDAGEHGLHRQYGVPIRLGNGRARTYVVLDARAGQAPVELGVALDARALDGLPNDAEEHSMVLQLPARSPAPYQFVELDWNPQGHEPRGVYTFPHFDFHFYALPVSEWNTIVPSDPSYAAHANRVPTGAHVPPFYVVPGPPAVVAVPKMGVHWLDVRSPELQNLFGNPAGYRQFTKTFIYGSWNGRFTFYEPMITRAYLLSHPDDVVTPIPTPSLYPLPGYYPRAYRVTYDPQEREYRVALTSLTRQP